jgi:hypothetical protein
MKNNNMIVKLNLKEKIAYRSFNSQDALNNFMIDYIFDSKADKIIFKGDPWEINLKLLKKLIDKENPLVENGDIRGAFRKIIQTTHNEPYCVIYKE